MIREVWDAYDAEGNKLGIDIYRDEPVPDGMHHIVVEIYLITKDGKMLTTQRHPNKGYPLKWEVTGGSIVKGETSKQGAIRELLEETGIEVSEDNILLAHTEVTNPSIYKCYVAIIEHKKEIRLQEGETVDFKWVSYEEFFTMIKTEDFVCRVSDEGIRKIKKVSIEKVEE